MPVHSGTRSRGVSHRVSHGSGKKSPDSANCIIAVSNEVSTRLRTARNQLLLQRTGSNSLRNASNLFPPGSVVNLVSALSVGVLAVSRWYREHKPRYIIDIYIFYSYSNWRIILYIFFTNLLVFNVHKYIKILIWKKLTPYWRWCRICSGKIYIHVCTITVTSPSVFDVSLIVRLRWINQSRVEINGCGWVAVGWRRLFC